MSTAYKKMTSHGSISIPVAMRRELGIEPKDPMIVEEHQGEIRIKPYTLRCNFCGTTEDVHELHGKGICQACATKACPMNSSLVHVCGLTVNRRRAGL